jgi:hypothetical protein
MQNDKVGEGDVFSQQKCLCCLSCIQNFNKILLHYIKGPKGSIRQFNYVTWVLAATFNNITSISKFVFANHLAKGLRLHEALRTWSCSSGTVILRKEKECRKIEAIYRKVK